MVGGSARNGHNAVVMVSGKGSHVQLDDVSIQGSDYGVVAVQGGVAAVSRCNLSGIEEHDYVIQMGTIEGVDKDSITDFCG